MKNPETSQLALAGEPSERAPSIFLRPTSAVELFDRSFLLWRARMREFLALGAAAVAPSLLLELTVVVQRARGASLALERLAPLLFLAFLVQMWPIALALQKAHALAITGGAPTARVAHAPSLLATWPRLLMVTLFVLLGAGLFLDLAGVAAATIGPTLAALVLLLVAVGAALFFVASFVLAPLLVAIGCPSMLEALRQSYWLMRSTRFAREPWRDNAYWRLLLLASFPVSVRAAMILAWRVAYVGLGGPWVDFGTEPPAFLLLQSLLVAAGDLLLVPWTCVALAALAAELACRRLGSDLQWWLSEYPTSVPTTDE